jgi:hypothetical protein
VLQAGELAAGPEREDNGGVVQCYLVRAGGVAVWRDPVEVGPERGQVPLESGARRGLVIGGTFWKSRMYA